MKTGKRAAVLLGLVTTLLFASLSPVLAQDGDGWGDFFDPNGDLQPGVTDMGVQTLEVDWMPELPNWVQTLTGWDFEATYHAYATESGQSVLLPTASTLFFMSMNPVESGLAAADGQVNWGSAYQIQGAGQLAGNAQELLAGLWNGLGLDFGGYTDELADALIAGDPGAWSTLFTMDAQNMLRILTDNLKADKNYYTVFLLYNDCHASPAGCPADLKLVATALSSTPFPTPARTPTPRTQECPADVITPGVISASLVLLDPPHPLVVGQDPERRGADLEFRFTITPTLRRFWQLELVNETRTCSLDGVALEGCPPELVLTEEDWECVMHEAYYCEPAANLDLTMSLGGSSREWIAGELARMYPGAYLHRPDWRFTGGRGGCAGTTYRWSLRKERVQIEDPGYYTGRFKGVTGGTPYTAPRSFDLPTGSFGAYLIETTIIK